MTLLMAGLDVRYSLVRSSANQVITTSTVTANTNDSATADAEGWHSSGRITPDADIALVQLGSSNRWQGNTTGRREMWFGLNGTGQSFGHNRVQCIMSMPGSNDAEINLWTAPIVVATPGTDYYQSVVWHDRGADLSIFTGQATWFCCIGMAEG